MAGPRTALITGVTGQDGSYLAELLLEKGYGSSAWCGARAPRTSSASPTCAIASSCARPICSTSCRSSTLLRDTIPTRSTTWRRSRSCPPRGSSPCLPPSSTRSGVTRMLEAIRLVAPKARFYQASSSEMFGKVRETPQRETTPFYPRSPYGVAKVYGHFITVNYRESYGLFACSGILFNHESPRRGREFVTRKVSDGVAAHQARPGARASLGNLDARRDWGFAGDYVEAMWRMLQQPRARRLRGRDRRGAHGARAGRDRVRRTSGSTGASTCVRIRRSSDRPRSTR